MADAQTPEGNTGATLKTLKRIILQFRSIESDLPMTYAHVFLYVAEHERSRGEAPTITDIAHGTGISSPVVSRITQALGDRRRPGNASRKPSSRMALQLLERIPDRQDLRVTRWGLAVKGRGLLSHLEELIQ